MPSPTTATARFPAVPLRSSQTSSSFSTNSILVTRFVPEVCSMRGSAFFTAFLFCVLLASTASGQATSSLRGKVIDAQGAAIPGVTVQLTNEATGFVRDAFSDVTGAYQFAAVPPGTYLLTSGLEGFNTVKVPVTLQVNTPATLDVTLEVAALSEIITVEARIATLNTVDASVGNAFGELQVRQLPLSTRNVVELLSLQPGVAPSGEVAGARRDQNNITLDGVDINDNETNGVNSASQGGLNTGGGRADRKSTRLNSSH